MDRDTVGLVLAGVLAGLAVLLFVAAAVTQPFLVVVALPFAAGAYLVWKASVGEYVDARSASAADARRARARRTASDGPGWQRRERTRAQNSGRGRTGERAERTREDDSLTRREAVRVLGVEADADQATVRSAYRERVKEVHPDTEDGDSEAFQRVNDAYERLRK